MNNLSAARPTTVLLDGVDLGLIESIQITTTHPEDPQSPVMVQIERAPIEGPLATEEELQEAVLWADKVIASPLRHKRVWDWNTDVTLALAKAVKQLTAKN